MQDAPVLPAIINPTAEEAHWRSAFTAEPYYVPGTGYDEYSPAFRVGYTGPLRREGSFQAVLPALKEDWSRVKGRSRLTWEQAKPAVRAAWQRVCDRDGDEA
jgi:hypothetical protein